MYSKIVFIFLAYAQVYNFTLSATLNVNIKEEEKTHNNAINPIRKDFYTYYGLQNYTDIFNNSLDSVNNISNSSVSIGYNNTLDYDEIKIDDVKWCDCGPNSIDCRYVKDNVKICTCEKGYSQKYGFVTYCARCDCGQHAKSCEFVMSQKKCKCQERYTEFKEQCRLPECDCGPNSVFCSLDNSKKKQCFCKDGYDVENSVYSVDYMMCKRCDCGIGASSCKFDILGSRKCECKSGYSKRKSILDERCEKCDCGQYSSSCSFNYFGSKECTCKSGAIAVYNYDGETCQLKCDCGPNSISCRYNNNYRKCNCKTGYEARAIQSDESCYKKVTSISGWKIATYILLGLFGIIFVIQIKIIKNHNERNRT